MLSDLAVAVKGFWGYVQAFIESCRDEFAFGPDDIARRHFVVADLGGLVAGCYSVDGDRPIGELGNMWIRARSAPASAGSYGRTRWPRMADRVRQAHAFFRHRTPDQMLVTAAPWSSAWLPEGYRQDYWKLLSSLGSRPDGRRVGVVVDRGDSCHCLESLEQPQGEEDDRCLLAGCGQAAWL
jgi:hypothetical protein